MQLELPRKRGKVKKDIYVYVWGRRLRFQILCFQVFFFFFSLRVNNNLTWVHYAGDKNHCLRTVHQYSRTVHSLKIFKMGLTVLFTYLKIILLQYFQFLVSTTISSIQTDLIFSPQTPISVGLLTSSS